MVATVHPPEANHTWGGFSTARWEGDMLRIKTTHLKEDYIRRNGAMISDQATVTSFWIRRGDILTWINIVHDPVYLAEPLIRSSEYRLNVNSQVPAHPCTRCSKASRRAMCRTICRVRIRSSRISEIAVRPRSAICRPAELATMYPEYQKTLQPSEWTAGDRRTAHDGDGGAAMNPSRTVARCRPW